VAEGQPDRRPDLSALPYPLSPDRLPVNRLLATALPLAMLALIAGVRIAPGGRTAPPSPPELAAAPIAEAYRLVSEAEARHQHRFREAMDPDQSRRDLDSRLAAATGT